MSCIVFDTSTIISLVTNNLLSVLGPLKKKYGGEFCVPQAVKGEIIDRPLLSKKFKLEAMQVMHEIAQGTLSLKKEPEEDVTYLLNLSNTIFMAHGNYIRLMHWGEVAMLALAKSINADAVAVDERTTRLMIESPKVLARILEKKMHTKITVNNNNLRLFKDYTKGMTVIRSAEIAVIAYDLGLLNAYMDPKIKNIAQINPKRDLLDGILWGLKLRGCSINSEEISRILRLKGY